MHEVGPDGASFDRALRLLERSHDDGKVRDALGRRKHLVTNAVTGEPVEHYVYRLRCGHLEVIFTTPLPAGTEWLYCSQCDPRRDQLIVELVAEAPDEWVPPAERAEAQCTVCLEAAAEGRAVPVSHEH